MNWEKGIKRTVFVVSIIAFILGFLLAFGGLIDEQPFGEVLVWATLWAVIFFVVVWAIYYTIYFTGRWIIKGFREDKKEK